MSSSSILFIDSRVTGYQTLIDSPTEPLEVFILGSESDGLLQIAAYLLGRTGIATIHIVSHGSQGALYLGDTVLDNASIASYAGQLAEIGKALTDDGDILLYGCDVALGDVGLQFITSLAQYTRADIAASNDATGSALVGGDWVLEAVVGSVETAMVPSDALNSLLAVNTPPTFTGAATMTRFAPRSR